LRESHLEHVRLWPGGVRSAPTRRVPSGRSSPVLASSPCKRPRYTHFSPTIPGTWDLSAQVASRASRLRCLTSPFDSFSLKIDPGHPILVRRAIRQASCWTSRPSSKCSICPMACVLSNAAPRSLCRGPTCHFAGDSIRISDDAQMTIAERLL